MIPFKQEVQQRIALNAEDKTLRTSAQTFMRASTNPKYSYNFSWLGRPIIQYPQDMVAIQELIWSVKPDLIIETGIAHGGSLILNASMLAMIDYCEAAQVGEPLDPRETKRKVLGIDIDIRAHNKKAIEDHPLFNYIDMIEGSSIENKIIDEVKKYASSFKRVLVCLDSNHTHDHVLAELKAYAPLTSEGSYCVVFDTLIEDMPDDMYPGRPWGKGNNPKTAVWEFLKSNKEFAVNKSIENKLLITVASDGYLQRKTTKKG